MMRARNVIIAGLAVAAVTLLTVGMYAYQTLYEPYATRAVTQLEPAFLPSPPPDMKYEKVPAGAYDALPKIRSVYAEVNSKYRDFISDCPPQRPVYCDMSASTATSTTITATELESTLQRKDLNFNESKIGSEWISYVKRDRFVPQSIMQECYCTIEISRIY